MIAAAAAFSDYIVGVHVIAVIVAFGSVFAFPLMFAAAGRGEPSVIPWLLETRRRVGRYLVNPGLLVVVLAGVYLASDDHYWKSFFVAWGIAASLAIGAIEGALIIPRAGRLAAIARRDIESATVPAGGTRASATWSPEYLQGYRTLAVAGLAIQAIVVVTVVLMAVDA